MDVVTMPGGAPLLTRKDAEALTEALVTIQRLAGTGAITLIARLNEIDGDPDLETCMVEDDFTPQPTGIDFGPGCEIADCGEEDDSDHEHDGREPEDHGYVREYGIDQTKPPPGGWRP